MSTIIRVTKPFPMFCIILYTCYDSWIYTLPKSFLGDLANSNIYGYKANSFFISNNNLSKDMGFDMKHLV